MFTNRRKTLFNPPVQEVQTPVQQGRQSFASRSVTGTNRTLARSAVSGTAMAQQYRNRGSSASEQPYFGAGPRNSSGITASGVKRVGFHGRTMKDSRPITDRNFQAQMQQRLSNFLTQYNYTGVISEKTLKAPSKTEFTRIFEFIYRGINSDYESMGKIEEEVPAVFENLGYPIIIKSSAMLTIGAQHTWPHVLAALVWLIDFLQVLPQLNVPELVFGDPSGPVDEATLNRKYKYIANSECYKLYYMERGRRHDWNSYKDCANIIKDQIAEDAPRHEFEATEDLEERLKQYQLEHSELFGAPSDEGKLNTEMANLNHDLEQLEVYMTKIMEFHGEVSENVVTRKEERLRLQSMIENVRQSIQEKRQAIAGQKMSGDQFRHLSLQRDEWKREIDSMRVEMERLSNDRWAKESAVMRVTSRMREKEAKLLRNAGNFVAKLFPDKAAEYQIYMNSSRSATASDFAASADEFRGKLEQLGQVVRDSKEMTEQGEKQLRAAIEQMEDEKLVKADDELCQLRENCLEKGRELKISKEEMEEARYAEEMKLDVVRNEYERAQSSNQQTSVKDLQKQYAELCKQYEDEEDKLTTHFKQNMKQLLDNALKRYAKVGQIKAMFQSFQNEHKLNAELIIESIAKGEAALELFHEMKMEN